MLVVRCPFRCFGIAHRAPLPSLSAALFLALPANPLRCLHMFTKVSRHLCDELQFRTIAMSKSVSLSQSQCVLVKVSEFE